MDLDKLFLYRLLLEMLPEPHGPGAAEKSAPEPPRSGEDFRFFQVRREETSTDRQEEQIPEELAGFPENVKRQR
jgi:hypothetical protein